MRYSRRDNIDTNGKCDRCIYYKPARKTDRKGIVTEFARGRCMLTEMYKQRTETCKKFKEVGNVAIKTIATEAVKIYQDYSCSIEKAIEKAREVMR